MEFDKKINGNSNEVLFVTGTRFGSINQQLHILNDLYEKAYEKGVDTVINLGPVVDGECFTRFSEDYKFIKSLKGQADYVVNMYPNVNGITTYYMDAKRQHNRYSNDDFVLDDVIQDKRKDMVCIGDYYSYINYNDVSIVLDSNSQPVMNNQYPLHKIADRLIEKNVDFDLLVNGTQQEDYLEEYLGKYLMCVPTVHSATYLEGLRRIKCLLGGTFVKFNTNEDGCLDNIDYNPVLYSKDNIWNESGKDINKVKQLVIKK